MAELGARWHPGPMLTAQSLHQLPPVQLRSLAAELLATVERQEQELAFRQIKIEKLTHELALHRRWRFAARSEGFSPDQQHLFEETAAADLAAIETELDALKPAAPAPATAPRKPRRLPLPPELPRRVIAHEPDSTTCPCGCALQRIGEDVAEKLDYTPGVFTVERHVRGKWVCRQCETLSQAPVPAHVIDKGLPTTGLLAQVLVAKYQDHLPLYRQEAIFGRAGLPIPRSTLAQWVGQSGVALQPVVDALKAELLTHAVLQADETPVAMLKPGAGKTHRAYLWAYATTAFADLQGVVYDFAESRAGQHARDFLGDWRGTLVCDDYAGYKNLFTQNVTEAGCLAHARRTFFDLHAQHQSPVAAAALEHFQALYRIEREAAELAPAERLALRQERAEPLAKAFHAWLIAQRTQVPNGSAIAKAIDYSLKRWKALTRYLQDGAVPVDNNHLENRIRPVALGRGNWLFAGSLRAGQRAAAVMSLIQSAKLNGQDPYAYLRDVLARLPTQPNHRLDELLPHRWQPTAVIP
jgi:transposase